MITFLRVTVVTGFLLLNQNVSAQTSWYVNDESLSGDVFCSAIGNDANAGTAAAPFRTIGQAITTALSGDIIYVDAGAYSETVLISKSLTLRGAKYGVHAGPDATPVNRGTNETVLTGTIEFGASTDDITVDGFYVEMGSEQIGIHARGLNSKVLNNMVSATLNLFTQQCGIATRANGPLRLHSYEIKYNHVSNSRFGIYFDGNIENPSEIFFNYVTGTFSSAVVMTGSGGHHYKGNVIENNVQGMLVSYNNLLIEQNTVRNNLTNGIRLAASANMHTNTIINNFIHNNDVAINLTGDHASSENSKAHYNSMQGNRLNITSNHTALFDAACNWHNSTDFATVTGLVSGNVRYAPYLTNGVDIDVPEPGFQTDFSCIVIPVKITDFTGVQSGDDVLLQWTTEREINSSHFVIERSNNGYAYTQVGIVEGLGESTHIFNYRFTDIGAMNLGNTWFYRLKQVDRDGRFDYSNVISIRGNSTKAITVYPNPVKEVLNMRLNISGTKYYTLTDLNGVVLLSGKSTAQDVQIQTGHLRNGMYLMTVKSEEGYSATLRIVVLH